MALAMSQTAGSPRVTLTKTGTNGDFSVTRTVAGVSTPVRGTLTVTAGTGTLVDREAPQGVSVTYTAGADSTSGTTLSVGSYLIHPATQSLDTRILVAEFPEWTRPVSQEVLRPESRDTPIVVTGRRSSRTGDLVVQVNGPSEAAALDALLSSTRFLLLSTTRYQARYVWVAVGDEEWQSQTKDPNGDLWRLTLPVTEIERPGVISSGQVTLGDVAARYATIQDLLTAYPGGTIQTLITDSATWGV